VFSGAAEGGTELIGFDLAERGLAEAFEDLRDFQAGRFFDAFIEIHKAPGKLTGEERAAVGLVEREGSPAPEVRPHTSQPIGFTTTASEGPARHAITFSPQADAPSCPDCGELMVRNGSCYKCFNCGATSGCS